MDERPTPVGLTVFWPCETTARAVVQDFLKWLEARGARPRDLKVVEPNGDPAAKLREVVRELHAGEDELRTRPIRVIAWACCWLEEAMGVQSALSAIGDALPELHQPGGRSELVVLVPPGHCEPADKEQARRFFAAQEGSLERIPILQTVFVNEAGLAAETSEQGGQAAVFVPVLGKVLARELFDRDFMQAAQLLGPPLPFASNKALGDGCYYTTIGVKQLAFDGRDAARRVAARLQALLVQEGMLGDVSESAAEGATQRAEALLDDRIQALEELLGDCGPPHPLRWESGTEPAQLLDDWTGAIDDSVKRTLADLAQAVEEFGAGLEHGIAREAATEPGYLSIGSAFAAALSDAWGRDADDSPLPSDIGMMRVRFQVAPVLAALEAHVVPVVRTLCQQLEVDPGEQEEDELLTAWLLRSLDSLRDAAKQAGNRTQCVSTVLREVLSSLERDMTPRVAAHTEDPVQAALCAVLERQLAALGPQVAELGRQRAAAEQALQALPTKYGWWKRNMSQSQEYEGEKQRLEAQLQRTGRELAVAEDAVRALCETASDLELHVLRPRRIRAQLFSPLEERAAAAVASYREFVATVKDRVGARLDQTEANRRQGDRIRHELATEKVLKSLLSDILALRSPTSLVGEMLKFWPPGSNARVSYANCRDLADHYRQGASSLLARLNDYAVQAAAEVEELLPLGILEREGHGAARRAVAKAMEDSEQLFPFAPAQVAQVDQEGQWRKQLVVRISNAEYRRLQDGYANLFPQTTQFVALSGSDALEVACVFQGFSQQVIYVLGHGRAAQASVQAP